VLGFVDSYTEHTACSLNVKCCAVWVCCVGVLCGCAVLVCCVGVLCACSVWVCCVGGLCGCPVWVCCVGVLCGYAVGVLCCVDVLQHHWAGGYSWGKQTCVLCYLYLELCDLLRYCSLEVKVNCTIKMSETICLVVQCHIPEDWNYQ
jgi:hypothetical protein